jgi:hypothetical protein
MANNQPSCHLWVGSTTTQAYDKRRMPVLAHYPPEHNQHQSAYQRPRHATGWHSCYVRAKTRGQGYGVGPKQPALPRSNLVWQVIGAVRIAKCTGWEQSDKPDEGSTVLGIAEGITPRRVLFLRGGSIRWLYRADFGLLCLEPRYHNSQPCR